MDKGGLTTAQEPQSNKRVCTANHFDVLQQEVIEGFEKEGNNGKLLVGLVQQKENYHKPQQKENAIR